MVRRLVDEPVPPGNLGQPLYVGSHQGRAAHLDENKANRGPNVNQKVPPEAFTAEWKALDQEESKDAYHCPGSIAERRALRSFSPGDAFSPEPHSEVASIGDDQDLQDPPGTKQHPPAHSSGSGLHRTGWDSVATVQQVGAPKHFGVRTRQRFGHG